MAQEEKQTKASRVREGYVVSDKMDKTRVVSVTRIVQHPRFKKVIKRQIRYAFHDEKNESKTGDKVAVVDEAGTVYVTSAMQQRMILSKGTKTMVVDD